MSVFLIVFCFAWMFQNLFSIKRNATCIDLGDPKLGANPIKDI